MYIYILYLLWLWYIFMIFFISLYCRIIIESTYCKGGQRYAYLPESPCLSGLTLHNDGKLMLLLCINGKWYSYRYVTRPASGAFEA